MIYTVTLNPSLDYILEHGMEDLTEEDLKELLTFANAAASLITTRKGALRVMPTREEINKAFEKYGMQPGANKEVVGVAAALAKEAIENKDLPAIRFYLHMQYGLTNDPEIKEMLDRYDTLAKERGQA